MITNEAIEQRAQLVPFGRDAFQARTGETNHHFDNKSTVGDVLDFLTQAFQHQQGQQLAVEVLHQTVQQGTDIGGLSLKELPNGRVMVAFSDSTDDEKVLLNVHRDADFQRFYLMLSVLAHSLQAKQLLLQVFFANTLQ